MVLKGLNRAVQDVDTAPPVGGSALSVALEILLRHWFQKSTALDCLLVDDKISLDDLIESLLVHHFKVGATLYLTAFYTEIKQLGWRCMFNVIVLPQASYVCILCRFMCVV